MLVQNFQSNDATKYTAENATNISQTPIKIGHPSDFHQPEKSGHFSRLPMRAANVTSAAITAVSIMIFAPRSIDFRIFTLLLLQSTFQLSTFRLPICLKKDCIAIPLIADGIDFACAACKQAIGKKEAGGENRSFVVSV